MPRIPLIEQQSRLSGSGLGPGPQGGNGIDAIGQALRIVGNDLTQQKIAAISQSKELADLTAGSLSELENFKQSLASNDDYDSHGPAYAAKAKEIEDRVRGENRDRLLTKVWQKDFRSAATQGAFQVAVDAQKLKAAKVRTDLGDTLENLSNLGGVNEEQDRIVRSQAQLAIETNAAGGNIDYTRRAQLLQQFDENLAEASIRRDMITDPALAERKLAAGAYPQVSGEKAALWAQRASSAAEAAQRRSLADAEHQQRTAEHQQKIAGDSAAKELDALAPGQLTADKIEARRDVLSESDYRYFYREMRNPSGSESGPQDVSLYSDLRERAGRGEDVRDVARMALHSGSIRSSDYDRILGEVESERPGWRKVGYNYIKAITGASELNPAPGAPQLWAAASDEWQQWADAHPNPTPEEARKAYTTIGSSHQLADGAVKIFSMPWPTYGAGSRQSIDLKATADRTKKALDDGEITQEEYLRQGAIWKQWNDAMRNQQQAPK